MMGSTRLWLVPVAQSAVGTVVKVCISFYQAIIRY